MPRQFNYQEILPPLTSLDQFIEEQEQRQQVYGNSVSLVSRDEVRGLGATRPAFTSAMVSLSDYDDDFNDDDLERKPSLDDSGIGEDGTGNNEGNQNCNVNLSSEVVVLRKRITEIENENEQLKAQLKTCKCAGKCFLLSVCLLNNQPTFRLLTNGFMDPPYP